MKRAKIKKFPTFSERVKMLDAEVVPGAAAKVVDMWDNVRTLLLGVNVELPVAREVKA